MPVDVRSALILFILFIPVNCAGTLAQGAASSPIAEHQLLAVPHGGAGGAVGGNGAGGAHPHALAAPDAVTPI